MPLPNDHRRLRQRVSHRTATLPPLSERQRQRWTIAKCFFFAGGAYVTIFTYMMFHGVGNDQTSSGRMIMPDTEPSTRRTPLPYNNTRVQLVDFHFVKTQAERALQARNSSMKILTAYLEPTLNDSVPHTGNQGDPKNRKDVGVPPDLYIPLPLRLTNPSQLQSVQYPKLTSCLDMPAKLPIDAGLDEHCNTNANTGVSSTQCCPVDADPFLPWIHDVFPNAAGTMLHFVAQNKRRCNTGRMFLQLLKRLEPQVTLMQSVSVQRITQQDAQRLAPELWNDDQATTNGLLPRYRLAPYEEADDDGQMTRFLCRFHTLDGDESTIEVILGETLSTFPINYEFANFRKSIRKSPSPMLTPRGKDNALFWLSNFRFDCPIPSNGNLQRVISNGESILFHNGIPTIYVDLIPIRTSPRFHQVYFTKDMIGPDNDWKESNNFNAKTDWGSRHVLPLVEASGRWENIPICWPPRPTTTVNSLLEIDSATASSAWNDDDLKSTKRGKPHVLVACLWASASYATRGNTRTLTDTSSRLEEWIEFHLLVGFDHIYVYDNTGATITKNETLSSSLEETVHMFPKSKVTRIDWPSMVCNNNIPAHENTGERSSQYAAESSCRQRYGPYTEWLTFIDTDEYLIPMGTYESLKDVVRDAADTGTNILSFKSTRAYPDIQYTDPFADGKECGNEDDPQCVQKKRDALFIETYNCDFEATPKPSWAQRAKKQLYRPDYVLSHFVHYSTITAGLARTFQEEEEANNGTTHHWSRHFQESEPSERFTDEEVEAVMLHSKTTVPDDTVRWKKVCKLGYQKSWKDKCRVGFPWPDDNGETKENSVANADGFAYNCFTNKKLTNVWIPRLRKAMQERRRKLISS